MDQRLKNQVSKKVSVFSRQSVNGRYSPSLACRVFLIKKTYSSNGRSVFSGTERRALAARLDDWRAIGEWARPLGSSDGGGLSPDDDDDGGCVVLTLSRLQGERRSEYATTASAV